MEAGIEGAGAANSFGVSIRLPFEAATTQFLADDPKLVNFRYFFTRKVTFVKEAHSVRAAARRLRHARRSVRALDARADRQVGSRADRAARRSRRYVLAGLDRVRRAGAATCATTSRRPTLELFCITDDVHVALAEIMDFYRNYHSLRFVDGDLVLRMQTRSPSDAALAALNHDFADIITSGDIEPAPTSKAEISDNDVPDLARLRMRFDRHSYARLHGLIKRLNDRRVAPSARVAPDRFSRRRRRAGRAR